jgi:hypothetical protein
MRRSPTGARLPPDCRWLLAITAMLLVAWSLAVPMFEAPDEPVHWQYARWLHDEGTLPRIGPRFGEAHQPPLYYLLIAPFAVAGPVPVAAAHSDAAGRLVAEAPPRFYRYAAGDLGRYWPLRLSRIVTSAVSVLTVYFAYRAGVAVTGATSTGFLAGALTAFLPQFTFRGATISNDALVTMLSAAAVYLLVRLITGQLTRTLGLAIAATIACAVLSKINAVVLAVALLLALVSQPGPWSRRLRSLWVLALAGALVAPWFLRNIVLYGDLLGSDVMWDAGPDLIVPKSIWSPYFVSHFPGALARSFVGVFGWFNVYMPEWIYGSFATVAALGLAGCLWRFVARPADRRLLMVLGAISALALGLVVHLNLTYSQPQGRYLFPALTSIMLVIALGLEALPRWNRRWTLALAAALAVVNVWVLDTTLLASYATPPPKLDELAVVPPTRRNGALLRHQLRYYRFRDATPPPDLGRTAGPLRPGVVYAQAFVAEEDDLTKIELEFATYGLSNDKGILNLHLRSSLTDVADIASASIPLPVLGSRSFVGLSFPPIPGSRGRTYYVVFEAPRDVPPVTVWFRDGAARAEERFFVAGEPTSDSAAVRAEYGRAAPAR